MWEERSGRHAYFVTMWLSHSHLAFDLYRSYTIIISSSFLVKSYRHPMSLLYLAIPLYIRPSASGHHCPTQGKINGEDSSQTHGMKKYLCRLRSAIIAHYKPFAETDLCSSFIYQHNLETDKHEMCMLTRSGPESGFTN
jgi:hypothetical protein